MLKLPLQHSKGRAYAHARIERLLKTYRNRTQPPSSRVSHPAKSAFTLASGISPTKCV
ncbi:MAG: hypothetical protein KatS3mg018_0301 [Fimbriimonadales bacterium]|nr:MAG: hypothetical protein KatS3mg018_0301 [Fimbriimonadales bacterium]